VNELFISLLAELLSYISIAMLLFAHISEGLLYESHFYFVKLMIQFNLFTSIWYLFVQQ